MGAFLVTQTQKYQHTNIQTYSFMLIHINIVLEYLFFVSLDKECICVKLTVLKK